MVHRLRPAAVVEDADCSRRQRLARCSGLLSRMRPRNIFLNVHPQPFSCTLWENQKHSGSVNSHRANSMFATFSANCLPKSCICSFSTYVKTFFLLQIRLLLTFEHFHHPFPMPHKPKSREMRALLILYTIYIAVFILWWFTETGLTN